MAVWYLLAVLTLNVFTQPHFTCQYSWRWYVCAEEANG